MPTVVDAARVTTKHGAVWRTCTGCGQLAALAPDAIRCDTCTRPARAGGLMARRRRLVVALAAPGITAARTVYTSVPSDALRVAALVEMSAAAAVLARTIVKLRHLDPDLIAPHVADRVDLHAVLGRGRWLPTMTRHVPAPSARPVRPARHPAESCPACGRVFHPMRPGTGELCRPCQYERRRAEPCR